MCPLYESRCEECTHLDTVIKTVGERNEPNECSRCGGISNRIFSTFSHREFTPYYEARSGKVVTTERQATQSDRRNNRVQVRDLPWFKEFKGDARRAKRKPIYSTNTSKRTSKAHE